MKRIFIFITVCILLITCSSFVTYFAVRKDDNIEMVELLLKNFGWTPSENIVFGDGHYLKESIYNYLVSDIVPKSIPFGQELTTNDIDNMYVRSANFELEQKGLDIKCPPLSTQLFLDAKLYPFSGSTGIVS